MLGADNRAAPKPEDKEPRRLTGQRTNPYPKQANPDQLIPLEITERKMFPHHGLTGF